MRKYYLLFILLILLGVTGCGKQEKEQTEMNENTYEQISQEEAKALMDSEEECLILDVRTLEEYNGGHIPNAICIPNETISASVVDTLTDKEQLILVYCRSGNRSKQAAEKLVSLGYTNIKEFGGINTWPYETE